MKKISVYEVNAFTADGNGGNPAGVVLDSESLTKQEMQHIAATASYAETAFTTEVTGRTSKLSFFDPLIEVDLCGHATIAAWSFMRSHYSLTPDLYTQQTNAGPLGIELTDNLVFMEQPAPNFGETLTHAEIAEAINVDVHSLTHNLQPQIVSTGLPTLLVALSDNSILASLTPDRKKLLALCRKYNCLLVHPFVLQKQKDTLASVRNFGPSFGVFEDVATGTSNGALFCYLKKYGMLTHKPILKIEQGQYIDQPSYIYGKFIKDTIWIGGEARVVKKIEVDI